MGMAMCKQGQVDLPWKSEGDVGSLELEIQAVAQLPEVFASEFSLQPHLVIETKFHFVLQFADQASFLPLPPLCWDYKRMSPCLFFWGGVFLERNSSSHAHSARTWPTAPSPRLPVSWYIFIP